MCKKAARGQQLGFRLATGPTVGGRRVNWANWTNSRGQQLGFRLATGPTAGGRRVSWAN